MVPLDPSRNEETHLSRQGTRQRALERVESIDGNVGTERPWGEDVHEDALQSDRRLDRAGIGPGDAGLDLFADVVIDADVGLLNKLGTSGRYGDQE